MSQQDSTPRWPFDRRTHSHNVPETPSQPIVQRDPLVPAPPAYPMSAFWNSGRLSSQMVQFWFDMYADLLSVCKSASYAALRLTNGSTVLDIGAGTGYDVGRMLPLVGDRGEVWGVDKSPNLVREAKIAHPQGTFIEGDIFKLPFKNQFFDAVRVERVLMHTGEIERALHEVMRVTKPGGIVVFIETDGSHWHPCPGYLGQKHLALLAHHFIAVSTAGPSVYQSLIQRGLKPHCQSFNAVINASRIEAEKNYNFATSHYSYFKPASIRIAVEQGFLTQDEADVIEQTYQRSIADGTFLLIERYLSITVQLPLH